MPDYAGLKAEIAKPAYAGMTDDQIVAALETPETKTVDVHVGDIEGYFRSRLLMGAVQKFAASPPAGTPADLADGVSEFLGTLASPHITTIAMSDATVNAAVEQILGGLVAFGVITAQNQADLMAMATASTTIAATYGFTSDIHDMGQELLAARRYA